MRVGGRPSEEGYNQHGFKDVRTENGSSQGQNLALAVLCIPILQDSGLWLPEAQIRKFISQEVLIKLFCKSQSPHKSVNLLFISATLKDKLTILLGN